MYTNIDISEKVILELLKSALWAEYSEFIAHTYISEKRWEEVYLLSVSQGVQAIVFDGLMQLSESKRPSQEMMLAWSVNVRVMEKRYDYYCSVISDLKIQFKTKGIEMMLLKGAGLSSFYPIPAHREYGDIDIYLFGKQLEGDKQMQGLCEKYLFKGTKHSTFNFKQIPVENHLSFLNINRFRAFFDKKRAEIEYTIEYKLRDILSVDSKDYVCIADQDEIRVPSATFNFIFLTYHAAMHLPRGIVLRHLCDWACFLAANKGKYNERCVEEVLQNSRFDAVATLMTQMAVTYLGLPDEYVPFIHQKGGDSRLEHRILLNMMHPFPAVKSSCNWYNRMIWKAKRFLLEHWKYKLVHGDNLLKRVLRSLLWCYEKQVHRS